MRRPDWPKNGETMVVPGKDSAVLDRALLDRAGFEAQVATLVVLGNLLAEGPATARELTDRIVRSSEIAGEPVLPFKLGALYAVMHDLECAGAIASRRREGAPALYSIATHGRATLAAAQEYWRAAHLVIRAAATRKERHPA